MIFTTEILANILNVKPPVFSKFSGFSIDSRTLKDKEIFIALNGENFLGNTFIDRAINNGAVAAITDNVDGVKNVNKCLVVADINKALIELSNYFREQFNGYVISLTGSCGKTTTRHMVASFLRSNKLNVLESYKNYNNHFGVPYMLLKLNNAIDVAVLECGASAYGEIDILSSMIKPNVAAVTNVHPVHIEGFGNISNIAHTKAAIYSHINQNGLAVLPFDSKYKVVLESYVKTSNKLYVGLDKKADIFADNIVYEKNHTKCIVHTPNNLFDIVLPLPGRVMLENCLMAIAMVYEVGIDKYILQDSIRALCPFNNRFEFKSGFRNNLNIMSDCYNANPTALNAAVDVLLMQEGKNILVLGDMAELGSEQESIDIHKRIGKELKLKGVDSLWASGKMSYYSVQEFGEKSSWFVTKEELLCELKKYLLIDDNKVNILVKASRSLRFEEIVDNLIG